MNGLVPAIGRVKLQLELVIFCRANPSFMLGVTSHTLIWWQFLGWGAIWFEQAFQHLPSVCL